MTSLKNAYLILLWGSEIQSNSSKPVAVNKHANMNLSTGLGLPIFTAEWYISAFARKYVCKKTESPERAGWLVPGFADVTCSVALNWPFKSYSFSTSPFRYIQYFLSNSKTPAISSKVRHKLRMYFHFYVKHTVSKRRLIESQQIYHCISKYNPRIFESYSEIKL